MTLLSGTLVVLSLIVAGAWAGDANNTNDDDDLSRFICKEGVVLPVWLPSENLSSGDRFARGLVYFTSLVYMFVGVAIVADKFMASIEVITSKEKEVTIKKPNGETQTLSVRIWNETVSNLTLMALGSSAPEIMLSVIEIIGQNFEAGELGPGTIVGSASFNLFIIIAICVWVIPSDDHRKIKHLRVFFVTMTWSVFAYIWLYLILAWSSKGEIEVWEGLLTFAFFPATVITAYIADRRLLFYKYLSKNYRMNKRGLIVEGEGEVELGPRKSIVDAELMDESEEIRLYEEQRQKYMEILKELRQKHPECTMEELEFKAREEVLKRAPKSRAYYRLQANRKLMGQPMIKKKIEKETSTADDLSKISGAKDDTIKLYFDPGHYTVMENCGTFPVTVTRDGDPEYSLAVDYKTEDGTANAGSDYEAVSGTLIFRAGETHKQFEISIIDDDVFEEDEHFYVQISNPRFLPASMADPTKPRPPLALGTPSVATVMILDDDHSGIYTFDNEVEEIPESIGEFRLKVNRYSGARGRVIMHYKMSEGTAKAGEDFIKEDGKLIFENNETSKDIVIKIVDRETYEKDATFYVELLDPLTEEDYNKAAQGILEKPPPEEELTEEEKIALLGKPRLGDNFRCMIRIRESKEFKNTVDKLFQKANVSLEIGTSSWIEQFKEVFTVSGGDEGDEEEGEEGEEKEEKKPAWSDYAVHFLTVFWKFVFAFVPPTEYLGGWACFVVSIIGIGLLTAVVGDLASHFGCTVGLKDTVTAISFVALGTSVPDTFASKVAAVQDQYADSSIGNVTGSNAVNVFLGIGIAWSLAAIYHAIHGTRFLVKVGSLAFAVTLFCVCAFVACTTLILRRHPKVGGELGGPMRYKLPTTLLFIFLWVFYVIMNALESYGFIPGF